CFLKRASSLSVLLALLFCEGAATVRAADYALDDVKRGYRASLAGLTPLWTRCKFSTTWEVEVQEIGVLNVEGDPVEWAIDGAKFHHQRKSPNHHSWFSYDGDSIWELDYGHARRGEAPDHLKCAQRQSLQT